ncbi:MAG: ATP-binding protein, partial [Methylococcales bacterium]
HLCDYLFRVDNSRNRATGGSGLGLAICQRIVEAHHGTLSISASKLGGLCIDIVLNKASET